MSIGLEIHSDVVFQSLVVQVFDPCGCEIRLDPQSVCDVSSGAPVCVRRLHHPNADILRSESQSLQLLLNENCVQRNDLVPIQQAELVARIQLEIHNAIRIPVDGRQMHAAVGRSHACGRGLFLLDEIRTTVVVKGLSVGDVRVDQFNPNNAAELLFKRRQNHGTHTICTIHHHFGIGIDVLLLLSTREHSQKGCDHLGLVLRHEIQQRHVRAQVGLADAEMAKRCGLHPVVKILLPHTFATVYGCNSQSRTRRTCIPCNQYSKVRFIGTQRTPHLFARVLQHLSDASRIWCICKPSGMALPRTF
mmetsp:Transcript_58507/g.96034  ORF Transcript_58507/g.96034 Transcript_58507/m.96034 type:complete len:305 (-) Transcript_58507:270-1184(-)